MINQAVISILKVLEDFPVTMHDEWWRSKKHELQNMLYAYQIGCVYFTDFATVIHAKFKWWESEPSRNINMCN